MRNIETISSENTQRAFAVLRGLRIVPIWELQGATVHLVGSLANGLYMDSHDIDLHVYTEPFSIEHSFSAMSELAAVPGVKHITYTNLLNTEEACLEWHLTYEDERKESWTFDIIHILKGSKYDGYFEKQAQQIKAALTDETRQAILQIKADLPIRPHIGGIWIYEAVLRQNIRTAAAFSAWYAKQDPTRILTWEEQL